MIIIVTEFEIARKPTESRTLRKLKIRLDNILLTLQFSFMMDSKTQVPGFLKVKMMGLGFHDFVAKFVNLHA